MWKKYITRRLAVQVALAWNNGWGKAMKRVYGVSVNKTLVYRDRQKTEYYVDRLGHERYVKGLFRLFQNEHFLRTFHHEARETLERIFRTVRRSIPRQLYNLSSDELLRLYQTVLLPNLEQFYVRMWTVFNIGEPLATVVREELSCTGLQPEEQLQYLLAFSLPLEPNDVLKERMDLLEIARDRKSMSRSTIVQRLLLHTRQYQHIPMFDFDHEPYAIEHFQNELTMIRNPQEEFRRFRQQFSLRKKGFRHALDALKPQRRFQLLLYFLKENVFLRDHRDMIRQKLNLELRRFYQEVAHRLGLTLAQVSTLTNKEMSDYLRRRSLFPQREALRREWAFLLIQQGKRVRLFSGNNARVFFRREVHPQKHGTIQCVNGVIGSTGVARGIARIVLTNRDLVKVRRGDILITPMTRQDFVPAIRRSSALVTDEGGVTAHAAIIARELGIPCVLATKIATSAFRDGDVVEVDANQGEVRKL